MARHFLDRGLRPDIPRPDDSTPVGSLRRPASSRESSMTLTHMSVMSVAQSTRGTESFDSTSFSGSVYTKAAASVGHYDDDQKSHLGDGQVGLMRDPGQVLAMARKDQLHARLDIPILARNPHLRERFRAYKVSDYFDHRGCRRFVNLSLSFAAKQLPASGTLGLVTSGPSSPHQRGAISARAYRLATQTVEVDRQLIRAAKVEELSKLEDADRFKIADVSARQEELLFVEVSEPRRYLPAGVKMDELLPPDTSAGNAREENRRAEKLNATLQDVGQDYKQKRLITSQHWRLDYKEAIEVARSLSAWMLTTGHSSSQGMERSVFCRFLLDLGIIHHTRIPYVWAVELFDSHARLLEVRSLQSPQDGEGSYIAEPGLQVPQARSYTVPVLCKWDCLTVIDIILRRWSYLMRSNRDQSSLSSEPPKKDGRRVSVSGAAASQQFLKLVRAASRHIATQWDSLEGSASSAGFLDSLTHDRGLGSTTSLPASPRNRPPAILVGGGRGEQKGGGGGVGSPKGGSPSRPRKGNLATVVKEERKDTNVAAVAAWKRSRLLSGMLAEPEVLQVVEQYKPLFKLFFNCYVEKVDEKEERRSFSFRNIQSLVPVAPAPSTPSAMSFVIFMRFCQDLRLVPQLLSYHEVLQIYNSAECLEYIVIPPSRSNSLDSLASSGDGMTATLSSRSSGQLPRRTRGAHSGRRKAKDPRKQKMLPKMAPVGIESVDVSEYSSRPRLSAGAVPQYFLGSFNPDESTNPRKFAAGYRPPLTRSSSQHRSASKGSTGSPRLPVPSRLQEHRGSGGVGQDAVNKNPREQSKDSIAVAVRKDSGVSVGGAGTGIKQFGVAAFTESLLRLVFLYHELYGNPVQVSASSRAKAVWLLTYIHSVLDHYYSGHERRARGRRISPSTAVQETEAFVLSAVDEDDAFPVEGVSKPLASVLRQVDLKLFQTPSYQSLQVIPAAPGGMRREEVQEAPPPPATAPRPLSQRSRTEHLAEESATKRVEVNDVMADNFTFSEVLLSKIFAPLVTESGGNAQVTDNGKHVSRTLQEDMETLRKDLAGCHAEKCPLTPPPSSPQAQHLRQLIEPLFENCIAAPIKSEESLTMQSSSQLG